MDLGGICKFRTVVRDPPKPAGTIRDYGCRREKGMRIPHAFRAYDKTWRVRWWHDQDRGFPGFNPRLHHAHVDERTRIVTMNAELRGNTRRAFEAFVHEVMHIVSFEERKRIGRSRYRIRHDWIYHLDEPLSFALMAMGVSFRCVCEPCRTRKSRKATVRRGRFGQPSAAGSV